MNLENHNKRWEDKDKKLLAELAKKNYCTPCIAKKLGRTVNSIRNEADILNISLKPNDNEKTCIKCK